MRSFSSGLCLPRVIRLLKSTHSGLPLTRAERSAGTALGAAATTAAAGFIGVLGRLACNAMEVDHRFAAQANAKH